MTSLCSNIDDSFGPYAGHCRGAFDLTQLFEESILTIPLVALLLLVAPFRLNYLLRRTVKVERSTLLLWKLAAITLLTGTQLAALILWAKPSTSATRASLATATLSLVGCLALLLLSYAEHVYTTRPSTILNLYLLFSALFDAARARTLWLQGYNQPVAITAVTATTIKLLVLTLEAYEKRRILRLEYQTVPPEVTSGIFTRWFFWWQIPLFKLGYGHVLAIEDLFTLDKHLGTTYLHKSINAAWSRSSKKSEYSLLLAALRTLKWPILSIVFPRLCYIGFTFCQPFLISTTLEWSEHPEGTPDRNQGFGLIGAFFIVYVGIAISMGQHQHLTFRAITMIRGELISMLYQKATNLSITSVDPAASLTLMSADIERIDNGWRTMHEIWANLVEISVAIYLLQRQLGVACLIPVATAIVSIIGSVICVSLVMARQALWLEAIERRVAVTSAMLGSMKGVKMCGLTQHLMTKIQDMRLEELAISEKFRKLLIWNMGLAYLAPIMAPVLTFTTYSLLARNDESGTLDTTRVFTSLSLFALLQEPLSSFIMSLATFVGSVGCFVRIQAFLQSDVREDHRMVDHGKDSGWSSDNSSEGKTSNEHKGSTVGLRRIDNNMASGNAVTIKDGSFGWDSSKSPTLPDISLDVPAGKFTLIVGPVGSGKSTLLKAILGEVAMRSGAIQVSASEIAYCDQTPWHMNGTVRDSIIAFSGEDERWYQLVVRACALEEDFRQLPRGDGTQIGSKGIALSGGQSQRISLARAVYAQKDIVILDDVFSGLDAHTENNIFHNLLGGDGILRRLNTTVIVTSSRTKRLPYADHIVVLGDGGHITEQGSFEKLDASGGYVARMNVPSADWNYTRQHSLSSELTSTANSTDSSAALSKAEDTVPEDDASRRTGDSAIYLYYVRSIGWLPTMVFVAAITAYIVCQSFPTIWVNWWSEANKREPNGNLGYYLGIYAMLGVLALAFLCISCYQMIVTMVPLSGKNFHWTLLKTVLNSPMAFFAETDSGITINRFSQDLQLIDMDLPISALNTFATFILCIAQMILIGVGSNFAAISFPFLIAALYLIQRVYLRTSRQIRFMDLEAKSPLYSQFTETLSGLATLRAFGWQDALERMHHTLLDRSQRPYYLLYAVQRWLTLVLDMFVAGLAVLLIVLIVELRDVLSSGLIGVALVNVIMFSQNLKLLLTFWTTLETHIGAIARIKSFTTNAVSEHEPQENQIPPSNWPSNGEIKFENVSAGYRIAEPVLKSISLLIEGGQKVGICGRTGSGKSSMISSLFRMVDLYGGKITIDGLDISTINREEVRSKLVGVPQDTFLFEGTVRENADPAGEIPDGAIVSALQNVQLWEGIDESGGLDAKIDKLHLSHGQRQLFCFARAMLRPSPILILDEATSSVDGETDLLLQRIIREKFASHTVIAIVHKLESILDFDKVALLDGGELVEFDSPHALLSQPTSAFSQLYNSLVTERVEAVPSSIDSATGVGSSSTMSASSRS